MDIGDVAFYEKSTIQKMIQKFGKDETAYRFAWLFGSSKERASELIEKYLADDYVDDNGVKGGRLFWGDL